MCRYTDDCEPSTFYNEVTPRARKPYKCYECDASIAVGDRYVRVNMGFDGTAETYKVCVTCRDVSRALVDAEKRECDGHSGGWVIGALWDDVLEFVREHLGYDPESGEERPLPQKKEPRRGDVLMGDRWG
jgi:hypothetical protein